MYKQDQRIGHNLFRNKARPDLYCAVPEDRTVPPFIREPGWEFAGRVLDKSAAPLGFREPAAQFAAGTLGFYVFHRIHYGLLALDPIAGGREVEDAHEG